MTVDSGTPSVPPARHQTTQPADRILHSANAGVVVERVAQIAAGQGDSARRMAREAAEFVNAKHPGLATVFVYEETFGVKDRLHWLIHFRSLEDYERLLHMGAPATSGTACSAAMSPTARRSSGRPRSYPARCGRR